MPGAPAPRSLYLDFLRSRWPARSRLLAFYAFAGSFIFALVDWLLTRVEPAPQPVWRIAAVRLPWLLLPAAGWLFQRLAPASRLLPPAVIGFSVAWTWGNLWAFQALGLGGSVAQAITLCTCSITSAIFMPLTGRGRTGVFALMGAGLVGLDLLVFPGASLERRILNDGVVLAFVVIQTVVFQNFASSQRRGILLRRRLENAVDALEASRQRAADAVAEVGRLAASVAHEVNNPLSAVKVNVRWLGSDGLAPEDAPERAQVVAETLEAVDRIARIVVDLKSGAAARDRDVHQEDTSAIRLLGQPRAKR
jgi:signal transduction histidine kinase